MNDEGIFGKSVVLKGFMDDPHCPDCDTAFSDNEIDIERCPVCGCLLDWKIYHLINEGG